MPTTYRYRAVTTKRVLVPASVSLVFSWDSKIHAVALRDGQPLIVGRGQPAHVLIDERGLSRAHARFWLQDGEVRFEDLGSTNGVLLEGERVPSGALGPESVLRLGGVEVLVAGPGRRQMRPTARSALVPLLEHELARARHFGRSLALVALESVVPLQEALPRVLRPVDMFEQYAPQITLVLLPEAGEPEVKSLAVALASGGFSQQRVGAVTYPGSTRSAEELIADAIGAARAAKPGVVAFATAAKGDVSAVDPVVLAPRMTQIHALIARVARTTMPVLIVGETGSGKESLARAVHARGPRQARPFCAINCAALPTPLIASTLFGHERGAFTGADRQTAGLFERSEGGTLFLDEVGELSLEAQAMLLRVLETKRVTRVGGNKEIEVDVRVVAATNRDLADMVALHAFREDLLYRLDAFSLQVPPLRERVEEIIPLAERFLSESRARWNCPASKISRAAKDALIRYSWPGNIRQLRNVVERAAVICAQDTVEVDEMPDALFQESDRMGGREPMQAARDEHEVSSLSLPDRIRQLEIQVLRDALAKARGNQSEAARLLGLPRRTVAHKVHTYGLLESGWSQGRRR